MACLLERHALVLEMPKTGGRMDRSMHGFPLYFAGLPPYPRERESSRDRGDRVRQGSTNRETEEERVRVEPGETPRRGGKGNVYFCQSVCE